MPDDVISTDDPRASDVRELLERHLAFARGHSPPQDAHALDVDALVDPAVTFLSYRRDGELLAVGALRRIDDGHAEIKSMHTVDSGRGHGIGRAMLDRLVDVARRRGYRRVSLETGTMVAFDPARRLYERAGFVPCEPYGGYGASPNSIFMTMWLHELS